MFRLRFCNGQNKDIRLNEKITTVGQSAKNTFVLQGVNIQNTHAQFVIHHDKLYIMRADETNETLVNGEKISLFHELKRYDVVAIGNLLLAVIHDPEVIDGPTKISAVEDKIIKNWLLIGLHDVIVQYRIPRHKTLLVGRSDECDIAIKQGLLSRKHAEIELIEGDYLLVRDLKSTNGTYVNDQRIEITQAYHQDVIRFDDVAFEVHDPRK